MGKMKSFHCEKRRQSSALTQRLMVTFQIWNCFKVFFFCSTPRSSASRLHLNVCPAQISCHNHRSDRNSLLNTGCTVVFFFAVPVPVADVVQLPSHRAALARKRETGRQCPWFFKAVRLVNALIFMLHHWINHCGSIAPFKQTSAQLSHEPTFLFSLFLIFYSESVSLCFVLAAQAGQRSGWSWQGFSVLLKDTLADWVLATVGLEPSYPALQPQHWQLIWISKSLFYTEYFYLALLFLDFLKRQRVINGFYLQIGNYNNSGNA